MPLGASAAHTGAHLFRYCPWHVPCRSVKCHGPEDRIIEVRPGDPPSQLEKIREVMRVMDADMGFVPRKEG